MLLHFKIFLKRWHIHKEIRGSSRGINEGKYKIYFFLFLTTWKELAKAKILMHWVHSICEGKMSLSSNIKDEREKLIKYNCSVFILHVRCTILLKGRPWLIKDV